MADNPDDISEDPERRRWWLITKALENLSFEEALKWAKAAEDFLLSGADTQPDLNPPDAAAALAIVENVHPDRDDDTEETPSEAPTSTTGSPQEAVAERSLAESLVSLASVDDVIRYLRQRGDVVVRASDDRYLVNGRFRETADQLLLRANKMRVRQRRPLFEFVESNKDPV